jgi:hypothetical protein
MESISELNGCVTDTLPQNSTKFFPIAEPRTMPCR